MLSLHLQHVVLLKDRRWHYNKQNEYFLLFFLFCGPLHWSDVHLNALVHWSGHLASGRAALRTAPHWCDLITSTSDEQISECSSVDCVVSLLRPRLILTLSRDDKMWIRDAGSIPSAFTHVTYERLVLIGPAGHLTSKVLLLIFPWICKIQKCDVSLDFWSDSFYFCGAVKVNNRPPAQCDFLC